MNVQRGSYFEMTLPWTVGKDGYTTKINGQLFHVDASTSLQVFMIFINTRGNLYIQVLLLGCGNVCENVRVME